MKSLPIYWFWQNWSKITTAYLNSGGCHQHLQIVHHVCLPILFHGCLEVSSCAICLPWNEVRVCLEANACGMSNRLSCALLGEKCTCVLCPVSTAMHWDCAHSGVFDSRVAKRQYSLLEKEYVLQSPGMAASFFSPEDNHLGLATFKVCMSRWQGATMAVRRCWNNVRVTSEVPEHVVPSRFEVTHVYVVAGFSALGQMTVTHGPEFIVCK